MRHPGTHVSSNATGNSMLRTSAPPGDFLPYPVSGVSLHAADTNFYLMRDQPFSVGHYAPSPLQGAHGQLIDVAAGCTVDGCAVPPGEFCRTLRCHPPSLPTRHGCM